MRHYSFRISQPYSGSSGVHLSKTIALQPLGLQRCTRRFSSPSRLPGHGHSTKVPARAAVQSGEWLRTRNIQSGAIVTELLKPYDYFTYWLSRDLGRALAHFLIRGIPTFLIGVIAFDLLAPESWARGVAFLMSVVMAVIVSFCLRFMANLAGFWVLDYRGIAAMFAAVMNVLSGMLAPLAFLPEPVRLVANALPFRAVIMMPNEVYLGQVPIWQGLGFQALWIGILIASARRLMAIGERRLVVQGG